MSFFYKKSMMRKNVFLSIVSGFFLFFIPFYSLAQPAPQSGGSPSELSPSAPSAQEPPASSVKSADPRPMLDGGAVFKAEEFNPVFFTYWEHVAIRDARNSRGLVRPLTDAELAGALKSREFGERVKPPPEEREIRLSGIVYKGSKDWTIWLNGKRVTPDALPKEVHDLKVYKSYVEMKWFDEYTNQIFPLRIRPHQRFNIDTRIFLPG